MFVSGEGNFFYKFNASNFYLTNQKIGVHTVLVLLQATTLNVAINSKNKALITIMMSNNVTFFPIFAKYLK